MTKRFTKTISPYEHLVGRGVKLWLAPLGRHIAKGMAKGRTVWIDPSGTWPAHTLLHELLHIAYPKRTEALFRRETTRPWGRLGWKERAKLLMRFGTARIVSKG